MWLLSTDRAELHYFISPVHVQDGYAILSHVWNNEEQSFKDVRKIIKTCTSTGENPRDLVSAKIRRCCELAESHGFKWIWNDTCCIDKSSSAELSEAINSMFQYYAMSRMCYAYLEDVPSARPFVIRQDDRSWTRKSYFSGSNWHLRGWTLQELIAPRTVLFISQDWVPLGTKVDLAAQLEDATGIPRSILTLDRSVNDFSIAQRMSWAAERRTTRVEDEAYSLLGIFEISMPIMYGEGRNAFLRLQEEIMRRSTDTTLFAWGPASGKQVCVLA
ncbi:HET-domain-containing protein [Lentinus tigrinus ALCF2SS1-6]|uniref:HET-domain-containing protein n=1 Tax=Lentinus tigrinus ALCF2SS1-6 TaxID=1328759 RepID=A0A5C2S4X0_9APHY|nr:HET-domain-containing protein [Lentinus tigrinus ALCF2SS1-6]